MTIGRIQNPFKRRGAVILTLLIVPFALLALALVEFFKTLTVESIATFKALPSAWKGPKLTLVQQADRVNRRLLLRARGRCIVALPLFPFAVLFDLVPDLGRAIVAVFRKNYRESRGVVVVVARAWKGAAYI